MTNVLLHLHNFARDLQVLAQTQEDITTPTFELRRVRKADEVPQLWEMFLFGSSARNLTDVKSIELKIEGVAETEERQAETEKEYARVNRTQSEAAVSNGDEPVVLDFAMEYVRVEHMAKQRGKKKSQVVVEEAIFDMGDDIVRGVELGPNVKPFKMGRENEQRLKVRGALAC